MACEQCSGDGMIVVASANGSRAVRPCACVEERKRDRAVAAIQLPRRYETATLANFDTKGRHETVRTALMLASRYIEEYTPGGQNKGLVLFGSVGTGKTHIAAAIARELVLTKGARGLFCDFRELLKLIQSSYSGGAGATEAQILAPVLEADVLVLDELGAMRSTDWVADSIEYILGARYNSDQATIITTNYAMRGPTILHEVNSVPTGYERRAVPREESLGDRIGARMFSRLSEMCRTQPMQGEDYRQRGPAARR